MSDAGISITVRTSGMDKVQNRLAKANKKLEDLSKPMKDIGRIAVALVRSYPPYGNWRDGQISFVRKYPGAKYTRTKTLQKNWKGQLRRGSRVSFSYRVYNYGTVDRRGRPYLKYVQGDEQAAPHPGRWYTEEDMRPMLEDEANKILEQFMHDVARG